MRVGKKKVPCEVSGLNRDVRLVVKLPSLT